MEKSLSVASAQCPKNRRMRSARETDVTATEPADVAARLVELAAACRGGRGQPIDDVRIGLDVVTELIGADFEHRAVAARDDRRGPRVAGQQ